MKKYFAMMLAIGLAMGITIEANAITTGRWDFSNIPDAVQRAAEDAEPTQSEENPYISDELLQQIYAAKEAQRKAFYKWWNNR